MSKHLFSVIPGLLALCAILCSGCGGGGGGLSPLPSAAVDSTRGTVAITLLFAANPPGRATAATKQADRRIRPTRAFAGNIPYGALSVRVTVTNPVTGANLAPPRIVTAPANDSGLKPLINVQYAALPTGPVRVDVAAFPNDNATGNVLATGSVTGQITALQTTTLTAPMVLRVKRISISPTDADGTTTLLLQAGGDKIPIVATALDATDQPLDLPLMYVSDDPDIANAALNPKDRTQVLVTSGVRGFTQIRFYELNSEISTIVRVFVSGGSVQIP